ncbi:MAG: hypothetical protein OXP70_07835 [Acidobacteriota bacterium]|nr:hypothetical protein [Acidobacteriota bacterium]
MTTRKSLMVGGLLVAALSPLVLSCGDGGGGAPAAPPPPIPLSWNDVPDGITVRVGEEEIFTALLSAAVPATYSASASSGAATVTGREVRTGVYEVTVAGVEAGEVQVTLRANHTGYTTATASVDVVVEDLFDESLWRELVFDAYDCPNGSTNEGCMNQWGERQVERRITSVLPSQPDWHILGGYVDGEPWEFTSFQEQVVRDAIRNGVEQATGERFTGRITTGLTLKDSYGWVDVLPMRDEFWEDLGRRPPCGVALVGATEGVILINLDALDVCDLASLMAHEVGHALGFYHVLNVGDYIMSPYLTEIPPEFSEGEQFHALLAWELGRGAPFTPDPRKTSSAARMTTDRGYSEGPRTRANLPLGEMIECRMH